MSVDTGRRPAGPPPPGGARPRQRRDPRSVRDRVSFKPIAALLLIPIILATWILTVGDPGAPVRGRGLRGERDPLSSRRARVGLHAGPRFPERSTIYAADGIPSSPGSTSTTARSCRSAITGAQRAVLAIEDSDFFQHGALDYLSLIRAMIENARAGRVVQGGSTITQQLVGSTLGRRTVRPEHRRQAPGARARDPGGAGVLEGEDPRALPEPGVHGNGVYGFGTAAQFYFRKPARKLTCSKGRRWPE